ncbi:S8 family peptidase [Sphaerisporangium corydalis]|uniref:S8 family peptidase n=1 Tax=Sphaerisporangium corydalis TaxID=1441875 RepID=A0ABV9ED10_9ACTN|nr:S8 family peptidase [Sphaerisporangium corydalis]
MIVLSALVTISPAAQAGTAAPRPRPVKVTTGSPHGIPGQYIVQLKPGASPSDVLIPVGVRPLRVYQHVFSGFAAKMTPAQIASMRLRPEVAAIEEDAYAYALDPLPARKGRSSAPTTSWGLDRIDQRNLPLSGTFTTSRNGTGVTAYIIDSGIDGANSQFTGRMTTGYDAVKDGQGTNDCLGHGTMVAGIVGGLTWGVARNVKLSPVRVLGCDGSGAFSGIIAGFDWVATHAVKPAVANASLGGSRSDAANAAATALADSGVFVSVAAGNSTEDACTISPASAPRVLSVAASSESDSFASFSNYGACVDVIAPGVNITSAKRGGGSVSGNGTSFASPFVTGVGALFKQLYGDKYPTSSVLAWLIGSATSGVVSSVPDKTPNKLLYTGGL